VTALELIDRINIEKTSTENIFLWFDSYLFTSSKIIPTSKDIQKRFGLESPTFVTFRRQLNELFLRVQHEKNVIIRYRNWSRFLEIILRRQGGRVRSFLLYLSVFVKLLVHLKLPKSKSLVKKDQVSQVIFGDIFSKAGILNFIEEDFFVWIFRPSLRREAT